MSSDAITRPSEWYFGTTKRTVLDCIKILSKINCNRILIVTDGFIFFMFR